jgi:hypothetical protein
LKTEWGGTLVWGTLDPFWGDFGEDGYLDFGGGSVIDALVKMW